MVFNYGCPISILCWPMLCVFGLLGVAGGKSSLSSAVTVLTAYMHSLRVFFAFKLQPSVQKLETMLVATYCTLQHGIIEGMLSNPSQCSSSKLPKPLL